MYYFFCISLLKKRDFLQGKATGYTALSTPRERLKRSHDQVQIAVFDYNTCIAQTIEHALMSLQRNPGTPDSNNPFLSRLLSAGSKFHFPRLAVPKLLRKKKIISATNVSFGNHGGLVLKKELGRGTFGRVILVDTTESDTSGRIAIKVQAPTHSLAWEFVVLRRLEQRLLKNGKQSNSYAFPTPINFISLADGGILSMSVVSETGLNLVDLSNFYKLKLGKPVPELIAFHYTSVALRIIEQLHSHGKMLVRCTSSKCYPEICQNSNCFSLALSSSFFEAL